MRSYDEKQQKEQAGVINDCMDSSSKLSAWEKGFVSTCADMTEKRIMLSAKQVEILSKIKKRVG